MAELALTCPAGAETAEGAQSRGGDYALSWTGPPGATFRLVELPGSGDLATRYEGPELGTTITGRTEGHYEYRVGVVHDGDVTQWSEPCTMRVEPYPLSLALTFFAFGLVVTAATAAVIIVGHRAHRRGEIG